MSDETLQFFERIRTYAQPRNLPPWESPLRSDASGKVNLPEGFEIGRELRESVKAVALCGAELLQVVGAPLSDRIAALLGQLEHAATRIAVVGQIKAGKSSFINALTGRSEFLPTHVNPWTAVPTKLYFSAGAGRQKGALFEFFSEKEWNRLGQSLTGPVVSHDDPAATPEAATARTVWRRALVRLGERYHHLLGEEHRYDKVSPKVLSHYLCVGPAVEEPSRTAQAGRYADITRLAHIYLPAVPFASPTILIDTPGLNDPTFIRIKTTQSILEYADAYIVILTASQPLSFTDIVLLRQLRGLEKRRFMVFINRIDELDGGRADVQAVEAHVRATLRKEFPGASISVTSGSALWADAANDGSEEEIRAIATSPAFRAMADDDLPPPGDIEALRSLMFDVSGFPDLSQTLSDMMLASFLATEGARAIDMLNSAAEMSASAARRELKMLRQLINEAKPQPATSGPDFHPGIAQLEKRLEALSQSRERIAALIEASQEKIQTLCDSQADYIRTSIENTIDAFAASQKQLLIGQADDVKSTRWRCDTSSLLKQLETDFLQLFTATIKDIASVHDECIAEVKNSIEQAHSTPERPLSARAALRPDLRSALPALGSSIDIEIGQPWWLSWWGSAKSLAEKADELEREIQREFNPIAQRLVALAQNELGAFAEHARSTIAEVASSTISSTSARLHDLRDRLLQHTRKDASPRAETANKDYARSIKDMLEIISRCEGIIARLNAIGKGGRAG